MKIVLDAMGTDNHPGPDVAGAVLAAREFGETIILVGKQPLIEQELAKHETDGLSLEVVHAEDQITMEDKPNEVARGKPQSSIHIGINLVKEGKADAFVTAGNTGAALAISMFQLKRLPGVKRPALTAVGELAGNLITVVDVGANTDTRLDWLKQFAMMGKLYSERVLGVNDPRVGLLANGSEDTKGDSLVREAHPVFQEMPFQFAGNVEPEDLFSGHVDVIVTDGYVGNIMLKSYEATLSALVNSLRGELRSDWRAKLGALLLRPYLRKAIIRMDPTQYGGAPLLGVNGVVIVAHGGSTAEVVKAAIGQAYRAVQADVLKIIEDGLVEITGEEA